MNECEKGIVAFFLFCVYSKEKAYILVNTESFIEAWEGESCLWDVTHEKAKSRKELA